MVLKRLGAAAVSTIETRLGGIGNPERRLWRLVTLAGSLPQYVRYFVQLKNSRYGTVIPAGDPFFERKFVTPYLATFFSATERLEIQSHLCTVIDYSFDARLFTDRLRDGLCVWSLTEADDRLDIRLRLPERTMLEGDLTLEVRLNDTMLHRMSFAFVPGRLLGLAQHHVLFIGGSQGVAGTAEQARRAAKMAGEVNAPNLLLLCLRALGQCLDIDAIAGVCASSQPVVHRTPQAQMGVYDNLWQANHGDLRSGFYLMSSELAEGGEVLAANKSRTRRKRRLRQAQLADMKTNLSAYIPSALSEMKIAAE